jgi:hypothetical protein
MLAVPVKLKQLPAPTFSYSFEPCFPRASNQNNESLIDLDLSYNCIGVRGIRVLCAAVRFDAGFRHDFARQEQQQQPDGPLLDPMFAGALDNINLFLDDANDDDDDDDDGDEDEADHGGNNMVDGEQPVVALFGLDNPASPPLVAPPLPVAPLAVSAEQLAAEMELEAAAVAVDSSAALAAGASGVANVPLWRQHRAYHAARCRLATLDLTHAAPPSATARGDDEQRAYETKADRRLRRALTANQSMRSLVGVGGTPLTRVGAHAFLAMDDADALVHAQRHARWIATGAYCLSLCVCVCWSVYGPTPTIHSKRGGGRILMSPFFLSPSPGGGCF